MANKMKKIGETIDSPRTLGTITISSALNNPPTRMNIGDAVNWG
jgi:hypothetical protein